MRSIDCIWLCSSSVQSSIMDYFGVMKYRRHYRNVLHCHGRISSLRLDLGGFPPETRAAGSSVKVPLSLLERIILEGEFSEQKERSKTVCQFTFLIFAMWLYLLYNPSWCSQSFFNTWPPYAFFVTPSQTASLNKTLKIKKIQRCALHGLQVFAQLQTNLL